MKEESAVEFLFKEIYGDTGYIMGAYDAMSGIVHCPSGMTPTTAQLVAQVRDGLARYHGPNRGADHLLAAVFAQRAPCAKKGLT